MHVLKESMIATILFLVCNFIYGCSGDSKPTDNTVLIQTRDEIHLATDLYFPRSVDPPYPVILIRTPYNKNWLKSYGSYFSQAGYVVAIQDVRGRWSSEGEWEPFIHEGDDGYDTIQWLATRDWSTGKVGMIGGSYAATAQFMAAIKKPPNLATIVANVAPAMPFDNIPRDGGAFAMGWAIRWTDIIENAQTGKELQSKLQQSIMKDWSEVLSDLPVVDLDRSVIGREISYYRDWAKTSPDDSYWTSLSYLTALQEVDIPVFLQGGWFDPGNKGTRLAFDHLVQGGNRQIRMIIGPWAHGDRGTRMLNGIDMGAAAERDLMNEYRKWFDFWLKSDASDAANEPGVELYVMGSNRWINGSSYPLEETTLRPLYLSNSLDEDSNNLLSWNKPAPNNKECDSYIYNPEEPTPSFHAALKRGALEEYRKRINGGSDALIYESAPFNESIGIAGPIEVQLFASSSAQDTDWTATLYVLTEGVDIRVIGMTFGILRARYRNSMSDSSLLEPYKVYPFTIDLGHTATTINKGERLRLEIASAAFPEFSRNLNTGYNNQVETEWIEAHQCVYHSTERYSHLLLPVLNGTQN